LSRIFQQTSQTASDAISTSNTPIDVPGLSVSLPSSGDYRINYGITCKVETSLSEIPIIEIVSLLYDETLSGYIPEGRGEVSVQFGSESEEDLVSGNRSITKTISKSFINTFSNADTLKVKAMYSKPNTNDATLSILYDSSSGYSGIKGYLTYESLQG